MKGTLTGRCKSFSPEQQANIVSRYKSGDSIARVAQDCRCSEKRVARLLQDLGIPRHKCGRRLGSKNLTANMDDVGAYLPTPVEIEDATEKFREAKKQHPQNDGPRTLYVPRVYHVDDQLGFVPGSI